MKKILIVAALLVLGIIVYFLAQKHTEDSPAPVPTKEAVIEETENKVAEEGSGVAEEDEFADEEDEFADEKNKANDEIYGRVDVNYKGEKPTIVDFINAILSQEDIGEALGEMEGNWKKFLSGKPLPKHRSFILKEQDNYMRYDTKDIEEDGTEYTSYTEYCSWDCADSRYTLIVENMVDFRNGEPFYGQFSGLGFYIYNAETKVLRYASGYNLHAKFYEPEETQVSIHNLLYKDKIIECKCFTPSGEILMHLNWKGKKFEWETLPQ